MQLARHSMKNNMKKRILLLGCRGMLGSDMRTMLTRNGYDVTSIDYPEIDITDKTSVGKIMSETKPEIAVNCAAYTDVDGCETYAKKAFAVNAEGVKNIAEACGEIKAKLIHYSTDYIFDGKKSQPYEEFDAPYPLSVYGQSKLKGEIHITSILKDYLIIRTSWLFGKNGKNFVTTILRLAEERNELKVVSDQIGSPTYTIDLIQATENLIEKMAQGIYNVTNTGYCSWYEFAVKILELTGVNNVKILPITSDELKLPAKRPKNSALGNARFNSLCQFKMPQWEEALKGFLSEISETVRIA